VRATRFAFVISFGLLAAAASAEYRVTTRGGGEFWAAQKPKVQGQNYVFRNRDGTLMSLRRAEVVSVEERSLPKGKGVIPVGRVSPAEAAGSKRSYVSPRPAPPPRPLPPAYTPGIGVAPGTPDQYQYGRTLAPPPGDKVYEGPAPTLDTPPPPPPR
jgi:hypothetical protein